MSPDEGISAMSDSQCEFCGNTLHVGHRRDCITMPGGTVRRPDDAHRASGEGGSTSALRASAPEGIDAVLDKLAKARRMVYALNLRKGTRGAREWCMSIPARPDYDPDIVIDDALAAAEDALAPPQADAVAHLARAAHSLAPEGEGSPRQQAVALKVEVRNMRELTTSDTERADRICRGIDALVALAEKELADTMERVEACDGRGLVTLLNGKLDEMTANLAAAEAQAGRMREALLAVIRVADRNTVEFDMARAALSTAPGGSA